MDVWCGEIPPIDLVSCRGKKGCGYCRSGKERYGAKGLTPDGMCSAAFYSAYPYALAMIYDARLAGGAYPAPLRVACPAAEDPVILELRPRFRRLKFLRNLAERALRALGFPKDAIDKDIVMEVVESSGKCALVKGRTVILKVPDIADLCPASFFSLYPQLSAGIPGPFICPDPASDIAYTVAGQGTGTAAGCCRLTVDSSRFSLSSHGARGCPLSRPGQGAVPVDRLIPAGVCPALFAIAVPYLLTFQGGGYFKWRKDKFSVQAQCAHGKGPVAFEIRVTDKSRTRFEISIQNAGSGCVYAHRAGQVFAVEPEQLGCLHLFPRLFLFMRMMESAGRAGEMSVACPFGGNPSRYRLAYAGAR